MWLAVTQFTYGPTSHDTNLVEGVTTCGGSDTRSAPDASRQVSSSMFL
jgi:hypothetical protein